ncbi:hypothetical protein BaRGS_00031916 [Batillaria attramentaria]|uniref:Uncharacterized protein n=1 Tax=Batillaria attramentaria TaxID=370345 RepID=A0ABD0JPZ7_9CAEN
MLWKQLPETTQASREASGWKQMKGSNILLLAILQTLSTKPRTQTITCEARFQSQLTTLSTCSRILITTRRHLLVWTVQMTMAITAVNLILRNSSPLNISTY